MTNVSPKVWIPLVTSLIAGALLWLVTGDKEWLIVSLTGLVAGGIGAVAPPAPNVKQRDVVALSQQRR